MKTSVLLLTAAACLVHIAMLPSASALPVISGSVGGAPTGVKHINFDDLTLGASGAMTSTGPNGSVDIYISPNAKIVTGSVSGEYAAPYLSGNNGQGFASQVTDGADTTPYLTSGRIQDGGWIRLSFATDQQYLGLLWGSIDDYNKMEFFDANNSLVATVLGTDVIASPNGDQGVNGTLYVNINMDPFRHVVMSSTQFAFEFDNVAYNERPIGVPDTGSTVGLLGLALLGCLGVAKQGRSK